MRLTPTGPPAAHKNTTPPLRQKDLALAYPVFVRKQTVWYICCNVVTINAGNSALSWRCFVRLHLSDVRTFGFSRPGDDAGDGEPSLAGIHKVWRFHL